MKLRKLFRGAILGAPASGKGTISKKIIETFDVVHVSTGDIFRQSIKNKTKMGETVEKFISQGTLVPDDLVLQIISERLNELSDKNWLCDGFPRTLVQAEKLFLTHPLDLVINLKVPFDEIIKRAKGRLVHVPSGRIYNTDYRPPKQKGKDDITGEPLVQRDDDKPEKILERLNIYKKTTEPILEFYKKKKILKEFSGMSSDELWKPIEEILKKYMKPKS